MERKEGRQEGIETVEGREKEGGRERERDSERKDVADGEQQAQSF